MRVNVGEENESNGDGERAAEASHEGQQDRPLVRRAKRTGPSANVKNGGDDGEDDPDDEDDDRNADEDFGDKDDDDEEEEEEEDEDEEDEDEDVEEQDDDDDGDDDFLPPSKVRKTSSASASLTRRGGDNPGEPSSKAAQRGARLSESARSDDARSQSSRRSAPKRGKKERVVPVQKPGRRKRMKACEGCGWTVPRSKVSSAHRWGASVRSCISRKLTVDEHKAYLAKLEGRGGTATSASTSAAAAVATSTSSIPPPPAHASYFCPAPSCERAFVMKWRAVAHLQNVHGMSAEEAEAAAVKSEPRKPKRGASSTSTSKGKAPEQRRAASNAMSAIAAGSSEGGRQPGKRTRHASKDGFGMTLVRLRTDVGDNKVVRRNFEAFTPRFSQLAATGLLAGNLIRWDDSCRTRVGLLPLEPPMGSRFFEGLPTRIFRVAIHDGALSAAWNDFLDNEPDVVFGTTKSIGGKSEAPAASSESPSGKKLPASGRRKEGSSEAGSEGRPSAAWGVCNTRAPPSTFLRARLGAERNHPVLGGAMRVQLDPDDLRATAESSMQDAFLPVPRLPAPPSRAALEESVGIEQASRLFRAAARHSDYLEGAPDAFQAVGLPPGEFGPVMASLPPRLGALQAVGEGLRAEETLAMLSATEVPGPRLVDLLAGKPAPSS